MYSKEAGWKVRGLTRNPDKAQSWKEKGVEVVQADLDDKESLVAAFKGADAIFANTDFWAPFYNPATQKLLKEGQTINEYCYEKEIQQGKNIAHAAATVGGLERLVVSALCDVTKESNGKYTWVYHYDSKARIVNHIRESYPDLSTKMSIVQVGAYMANWMMGGPKITKVCHYLALGSSNSNFYLPQQHTDGTYRMYLVGSGTKPIPHFHTGKDLGNVVRATLQSAPGKNVLAVGSMLSWTECLEIWCKVNKVSFGGYHELTLEAFSQYMPIPGLGRELGEMMAFFDEFGYCGSDATVVLPQDVS